MTKTKWYPGTTRPVRAGWYERSGSRVDDPPLRSWWNGHKWLMGVYTDGLVRRRAVFKAVSPRQELPWRGAKR